MPEIRFNPINFIISLAVGWFVVSFLQALVICIFSGGWENLIARFGAIALFQDGTGALVNAVIIVVSGGIGTALWAIRQRR